VFGFLTRDGKSREYQARAFAIVERYSRLKAYCPAAAFVFAGTLRRTRDLVGDTALPLDQRLALIARNIEEAVPNRGVDGGVSVAALRFARLILWSEGADGIGTMLLGRAFATICEDSRCYRNMEERDGFPPLHEKVRIPLAKAGFSTVAELVKSMCGPSCSLSDPPALVQANIWNVLAVMDLRQANPRISTLLADLESAISGLFVPLVANEQDE
jgi:hypothetical protein